MRKAVFIFFLSLGIAAGAFADKAQVTSMVQRILVKSGFLANDPNAFLWSLSGWTTQKLPTTNTASLYTGCGIQ